MKKQGVTVRQAKDARLRFYIHKSVPFRFRGQSLNFYLSPALFSAHDLDAGSKLLLKTLAQKASIPESPAIHDLGCGIGTLGISLAKAFPGTVLTLSDRDALALELSRENALLNGITPFACRGELGIAAPQGDQDLLVCNMPAKIGPEGMALVLSQAWAALKPGGLLAVVVIAAYAKDIETWISEARLEPAYKEADNRYTVFHLKKALSDEAVPKPTSSLEAYLRGSSVFTAKNHRYSLDTSFNLPEFDTLSYQTLSALDALEGSNFGRLLVWNPGQGHIPYLATRLAAKAPVSITLAGRDLLQLELSAQNLRKQGYVNVATQHVPYFAALEGEWDTLLLCPEALPGHPWEEKLLDDLKPYCTAETALIICTTSTSASRMVLSEKFAVFDLRKYRGFACLILAKD